MKILNYINKNGFSYTKVLGGMYIQGGSNFYDFHHMQQVSRNIEGSYLVTAKYDAIYKWKVKPLHIDISCGSFMQCLINARLFGFKQKNLYTRGDGKKFWRRFLSDYLGPYSGYIDSEGVIMKKKVFNAAFEKKSYLYECHAHTDLKILKEAFNAFVDIEFNLKIGEYVSAQMHEYYYGYSEYELWINRFSENDIHICKYDTAIGIFVPENKFTESELKKIS